MQPLQYLAHYPYALQEQVRRLIESKKLGAHLLEKYPKKHAITSDKALFLYVNERKNSYLKNAAPLTKALFDGKTTTLHNALGTHHFVSRQQGAKLKSKNEIRIATLFKNVPEAFLEMIVAHELAHFNHKSHDKPFYKLCEHIYAPYAQAEFDLRLYLTHLQHGEKLWENEIVL